MTNSGSTSQKGRCVLPSIQDLLSDSDFDKLRLHSPEPVPNVATAGIMASQSMVRDSKALSRHEPLLRSSCTPPIPCPHSPKSSSHDAARGAPYPEVRPSRSPRLPVESAGKAFENHLPLRSRFLNTHSVPPPVPGRLSTVHQNLSMMDLPSYVLSADQCPHDDRRHGCGICHRRFNRPSSLMIHMNSHTGAQPFKCPFTGCTRRFSVNSNMRRHYRNHREGAAMTAQAQPYPASHYRTPELMHHDPYYASSASSSPPSSPSNTDDSQFDVADTAAGSPSSSSSSSPARAHSAVLPRAEDRPLARPRACTVPGCNCDMDARGALRPAFRGEPYTRPSPKHR